MEGGSGAEEAERWLTIAAKLLAARDMHGARTFAIRARESDPRYEGSTQVLAVSDTILAGGSLVNNHPDWYSVLQLARFASDPDLIGTQYRKLTLLLNPVRTRFAYADQALKLVYDAWSVLSNPSKKLLYDNELHLSRLGQLGQLGQPQPQPREPQTPVRSSPRTKDSTAAVEEEEQGPNLTESTRPNRAAETESDSEVPSFWTACPYCYHMFEYAKVYEDCTLRCHNCRRAFHAAAIPSPPLADGKTPNFCSWGFFPLGTSANAKAAAEWSPISAMLACPLQADRSFPEAKRGPGRPRKNSNPPPQRKQNQNHHDVLIDLSDLSDESDDGEWKAITRKGKGPVGRPRNKDVVLGRQVVVVHALSADPKKHKAASAGKKQLVASIGKKQPAKAAKDLGKLDLNVEFSNEAEEQARSEGGNQARHGVEDNMEGIEFFEGLDEFLSSLPILNPVGDDKVKAG